MGVLLKKKNIFCSLYTSGYGDMMYRDCNVFKKGVDGI